MGDGMVTANGIRLWHETFGDRSDPPMLLIMGLGAQAIAWDATFCRRLADGGRHVIRYDNRDVGLSQWFDDDPTTYTLNEMADDAVGLLDTLGITRAHVVGVSMGGMIAQVVAITHPERVLTLTSIMSTTGAADVEPPTPEALAVLTALPGETFEERLDQAMRTRRLLHGPRFVWDEEWHRQRATASIERAFHPQGTQRQMQAVLQSPPRVDPLRDVAIPTLVIHGTADPLVRFSGGESTAKAVPGSRLMAIEGMGHSLPPQVWDEVVPAILDHTAA